ncbi:hypothetical protein ACHAPT_006204 [Fusarium lateritium]
MPKGRKRSPPSVKDEPERPPPALRPGPKTGKERKFIITRGDAMRRAEGLEKKLGDETYNQRALAPGMKRWLSKPVIMVLSENTKKKVFEWCQKFDHSWLGVLFEAKGNDQPNYEYTAEEEEPILSESLFEALQALIMELHPDQEAYKRLWGFAQLVTTHSQRVFLMDELQGHRPELEYIPDGHGTTGMFLPRS